MSMENNTAKIIALTNAANSALKNGLTAKLDAPTTEGTSGQVLTANGSGGQAWADNPSDAQVETAVDAWLDENITNPDSPPLDRSLSSSSSAAPADMVGDIKSAISSVESRFDNPNVMDYSSLTYDDRFCQTTDGQVRPHDTGTNSIIFAVEAGQQYYLDITGGFNRRAMIGNNSSTFTTLQTYTVISSTADGTTGIIFTVPTGISYVMLYFRSDSSYVFDKSYFSLYVGSQVPEKTQPTLKTENLSSDVVLSETLEAKMMEKSPAVYGYKNYTENYGFAGTNQALTQIDGVGISDPIYGIGGKPIRWYHGLNNITSITLWLVEYKSDGTFNTAWGMLSGETYRDIVSLKSDTAYIRASFILSYKDARVIIANNTSSSTVYWKPEYIGGANAGSVPSYYFNNLYLQAKCNRINELLRTTLVDGDAFFFITDVHWDLNQQHSPALIQYIHDHTGINKIVDGGDRDDGYGQIPTQYEIKAIRNDNVYPVIGNHEFLLSASRSDAFASAYQHIGNNVVWGDVGSFYYYLDNPMQKIRYIVLQSFDASGTDSGAINGYTEDELDWFTNVALNVETGWTIIVFTHSLIVWNRETKEPVTPTGITAQFVDAIEEYSGNGTIACVIQGHLHGDWVYRLSNNVPLITTTCDKNDFYNEEALSDVVRENGTIDEQAFDVFVLDKENTTIHAVRIGYKAELNDGTFVEERTVTY